MSSIVCFDIRNFSIHFANLSASGNTDMIFKLIENIFTLLDEAIKESREELNIKGKTFVNHTGDGFVAIFYGKDKSLQSLFVASLLSNTVKKLISQFNEKFIIETNIKRITPLDYGIGVHRGAVKQFNYHPIYPAENQIVGFLGNALNVSNRVQESTKDHTFRIICTDAVHKEAISIIIDKYNDKMDNYFIKLGRHKLRGMNKPLTLYGVKKTFANKIKELYGYKPTKADN